MLRRGGATLTDDYRMTICVHASVHLLSTLGVPCVACSFIVIWRKDAVATLWRSSCVGGLPRGFTHIAGQNSTSERAQVASAQGTARAADSGNAPLASGSETEIDPASLAANNVLASR